MLYLLLTVISPIIMALIFGAIVIFDRKNVMVDLQNIKLIVLSGILVAVAVALNKITQFTLGFFLLPKFVEFKIGNFALVLIGFFCGGALGFLSGIAADVIGLMFSATASPLLFYTLTSIICCIGPYYVVKWLSKIYYHKKAIYFYLPITYSLLLLVFTCINPLIMKYLYDAPGFLTAMYITKAIKYPFEAIITSILLVTSCRIFINSASLTTKIYHSNFKPSETSDLQMINQEQKIKEVVND